MEESIKSSARSNIGAFLLVYKIINPSKHAILYHIFHFSKLNFGCEYIFIDIHHLTLDNQLLLDNMLFHPKHISACFFHRLLEFLSFLFDSNKQQIRSTFKNNKKRLKYYIHNNYVTSLTTTKE